MFIIRWFFYLIVFLAVLVGGLYLYAPYNNGPLEVFPGGAMTGPAGIETNWDFVKGDGVLDLELRPEQPYSVRVNFIKKNDNIYIDPAPDRNWYAILLKNLNVRVRFDREIYDVRAVEVTDPTETEGMDPTRIIYRLEMR